MKQLPKELYNLVTCMYAEITQIEEAKKNLTKREQEVNEKLAGIKKIMVTRYSHLIGKKAYAVNEHGVEVEVICNCVKCNDMFEVIPLFQRNGKNYNVESFEWAN